MINEKNAKGIKGFLIWNPKMQDFVFRVYNKNKTFNDYRILCEELHIEISGDSYSLFSTEHREYIDWSTKAKVASK